MPVPKYLSLLLPDGQDAIVHVCAPDEVCVFNSRKNYTLWHEKKNQPTDPILSITFVWFLFTGGVQLAARYDLLSTGSAFTVCAIFFMAPFYQRVLRMDFNNWLSFAAASMLILILPGPTILTILSHTLTGGRRVIWAAVAAVACGDLISMSLALIGLGALLAASALAFTAFKWLGALYLIWLGINMLRTAVRSDFNAPSSDTLSSRRSIFYKLFWVTVLNPKSIGFFAAFLPQFIDPTRSIMIQSLVMLATFVSFGALNALAYGYAANHLQAHLNRPCIKRWVAGLAGSVLITMGAVTARLEP